MTYPDVGLALVRVTVGAFFAISGYHKLFNADRHASLVQTLKDDKVPFVRFNEWWVPSVELGAGTLLALGAFSIWAALLLGAICLVATCVDGWRRVWAMHPVDWCDCLDDLLYLPEVLYGIMLLVTILCGPGDLSIDHFVETR